MRREKRKKKCLIFACVHPLQTDMRRHRCRRGWERGPGRCSPPRPTPPAAASLRAAPATLGGVTAHGLTPVRASDTTSKGTSSRQEKTTRPALSPKGAVGPRGSHHQARRPGTHHAQGWDPHPCPRYPGSRRMAGWAGSHRIFTRP